MSKTKSKPSPAKATEQATSGAHGSYRETVESIVIAFVLAFLFRTFEAEAFVIPTGSMAPTLMGQHKDLNCAECGFPYRVGASDEDKDGKVIASVCPNCRFPMDYNAMAAIGEEPGTYKGDRILVSKFPFDPQVWDVAVFKYPEEAQQNFIKRVVGRPNTEVKISHGDIFSRPLNATPGEEFQIERKPPGVTMAMMQTVYDNDYVEPEIIEQGWPARWHDTAGAWEVSEDYRSFHTDGSRPTWLRYRHFVPLPDDWLALRQGNLSQRQRERIRPSLITDFAAYNAGSINRNPSPDYLGLHWVGDLAVECQLQVKSGEGQIVLELIEGGHAFTCRFDVAEGTATLGCDDLPDYAPQATTSLKGPGTYHVRFANVDDRLLLWINDEVIDLGDTTFTGLYTWVPNGDDLEPVGLFSEGVDVEVSHLKVLRDVYYIATKYRPNSYIDDYKDISSLRLFSDRSVLDFMSDPSRWIAFSDLREVTFPLTEDQFLMLGDNSPKSKDSRLWDPREYFVSRDLLIGRAVFVYWPHSLDEVPGTDIPFPFFPNVKRMKLIR